MQKVLNKTLEHRRRVIVAAGKNVKLWSFKVSEILFSKSNPAKFKLYLFQVLKIKSIFHTLNMFSIDVTQKCLIAECWVPTADMALVLDALRRGTVSFFELKIFFIIKSVFNKQKLPISTKISVVQAVFL